MISKGSRVRHTDEKTDELRGIMSVLEIKNGVALCAYLDYERLGIQPWNYDLKDLQIAND